MFQNGFAQAVRHPATLIGIALIALVPLAVWVEKAEPTTWNTRLALPSFDETVNRHTPNTTTGTYLPPTILRSRTITKAESPVHVSSAVTIPKGVTLTIDEGSELFFSEYALLNVEGTLNVNGEAGSRVIFQTGEEHIQNRVWSGIIFKPGSTGTVRYTTIRHASPGVTCEAGSTTTFTRATIELGNIGVFTQTPACTFSHSIIQYVTVGIVSKVSSFSVPTTTTISASKAAIQTLPNSFLPSNK